jgi:Leucine-rich repeat (LRR) protein
LQLERLSVLGFKGNALTNEDIIALLPLQDTIAYIHLVANKITNIGAHFRNFTMLKYLDLSMNALITIQNDAFTNCVSLQHFICFKCAITAFPMFNPDSVGRSLNVLNLKNNAIRNITVEHLDVFTVLTELHLNSNPIDGTVTSLFTWSGRNTLQKLFLRNIELRQPTLASLSFSGFDALKVVSFASDVLRIMPNLTAVSNTLTRLEMDRVHLKKVTDADLRCLTRLEMLSLDDNFFRSWDDIRAVFRLANTLQRLSLAKNTFIDTDHRIWNLTKLRAVDLTDTNIGCLPQVKSLVFSLKLRPRI